MIYQVNESSLYLKNKPYIEYEVTHNQKYVKINMVFYLKNH